MPTGLGDEKLWYSATINGDGTNMGSYTSTDMELKPFSASATIQPFDANGNDSFQSSNRTNNWMTDQNYDMFSEQASNMSLSFWLAADTMNQNAGILGFGRFNTFEGEVLSSAKNNGSNGLFTARQTNGRTAYSSGNVMLGRFALAATHVVMTWGTGTDDIKFYKNGVLQNELSNTGGAIKSDAYTLSCRFGAMIGTSSGGTVKPASGGH